MFNCKSPFSRKHLVFPLFLGDFDIVAAAFFLLEQSAAAASAAAALRRHDEGRRAKLWLWHCLFLLLLLLGGAWEGGRDPGLCAPVIWEMRKMRQPLPAGEERRGEGSQNGVPFRINSPEREGLSPPARLFSHLCTAQGRREDPSFHFITLLGSMLMARRVH